MGRSAGGIGITHFRTEVTIQQLKSWGLNSINSVKDYFKGEIK